MTPPNPSGGPAPAPYVPGQVTERRKTAIAVLLLAVVMVGGTVGFFLADKYGIDAAFTAPPVVLTPEPSTFVLSAVLGLMGLAYASYRRRISRA